MNLAPFPINLSDISYWRLKKQNSWFQNCPEGLDKELGLFKTGDVSSMIYNWQVCFAITLLLESMACFIRKWLGPESNHPKSKCTCWQFLEYQSIIEFVLMTKQSIEKIPPLLYLPFRSVHDLLQVRPFAGKNKGLINQERGT